MERLQFKITIDAPREKVWETLWSEATYPVWTSPFAEGGSVKTDWKKGSKVLFLDGNNEGMVSMIAENIPNEIMSFRHLGTYSNGVEDLEEARKKGWSGAIENYNLRTQHGKTVLIIDQDVAEEHKAMFSEIWPKALQELKTLAEAGALKDLVSESDQSNTRR
jgi:hypothetical protein